MKFYFTLKSKIKKSKNIKLTNLGNQEKIVKYHLTRKVQLKYKNFETWFSA